LAHQNMEPMQTDFSSDGNVPVDVYREGPTFRQFDG